MESKGFRLSMKRVLKCKFSDMMHETNMEVRLNTHVIQKMGCFKYLVLIISREIGKLMRMLLTIYRCMMDEMEARIQNFV